MRRVRISLSLFFIIYSTTLFVGLVPLYFLSVYLDFVVLDFPSYSTLKRIFID